MNRFFRLIGACCLLGFCTLLSAQEKVTDRWGTSFTDKCYNAALDADISFSVRMPPKMAELEKYRLVVVIKAGLKVAPSARYPFIEVKPPTGGIWGYRSMSGVLIRTVIDHMKRDYPVDEDRIYLVGFSAGASGAMQLASTHADQFAAVLPLVAVGTDYPIANFRNLPVAQHHGTADWTSSICNARGQHQRMLAMECPAELTEYPGVGHSVPLPHEPIVEWMLKQQRERSPAVVMHDCEAPSLGRAYWLKIDEFVDPHRRAKVSASVTGQVMKVNAENVAALKIDFDSLSGSGIDELLLNDQKIEVRGMAGLVQFSQKDQKSRWVTAESVPSATVRPYHAGAAANLYEGEPLLVVYGTASGNANHLLAAAKRLAACGGPHPGEMGKRFRVVADRDLTEDQQANFNLILVGAPGENLISERLLSDLPLTIGAGNLQVEGRRELNLENRVLSLLHPNPDHPKRLIYLVAPFIEGDGNWNRFRENPQRFLIGSDGFDRISQADLAVKNFDQQFCRLMQFGHGWTWQSLEGEDRKIPQRMGDRSELARAYMNRMNEESGADFALWWGPADRGMWGHDLNFLPRYDPAEYTLADFRTQHREVQTLTGSVSGAELRDIWKRWGDNEEMIFEPMIDLSKIEDERNYRLHVPMDFYIKLGQRKTALTDPKPGPRINIGDLEAAIFEE
jgi:hypothetical protein